MTNAHKTRCPHCRVAFRVTDAQLDAAAGMVRCGKCFKSFNGFDHLEGRAPVKPVAKTRDDGEIYIDDNFDLALLDDKIEPSLNILPTTPKAAEPASAPQTAPPPPPARPNNVVPLPVARAAMPGNTGGVPQRVRTPAATVASPAPQTSSPKPNAVAAIQTKEEEAINLDTAAMANWRPEAALLIDPEDRPRHMQPEHQGSWYWWLGSLLALLALVGQLFYFNSLAIAPSSSLWPTAKWLCTNLGCPLQGSGDIRQIVSSDLLIRSHPNIAKALMVDAQITNNGDFSQPYPNLTLIFENLQGETVAQRTFYPREYLQGELAGSTLMPSHHPVKLELEIVDPGKDAVSFRLIVGH